MYVYGKRAVVFAWLMDKWLADSPPPLRLKGLNPSVRYLVREINMNEDGSLTDVHERRLGGDFLMDVGIRIRWKRLPSPFAWRWWKQTLMLRLHDKKRNYVE